MGLLEGHVSKSSADGSISELPESRCGSNTREGEVINIGIWVFLSFAILTLVATAMKGFVPLDLLEVAFWAGPAWFWHKKKIVSQRSRVVVGVLAVLVAFGEGYSVARHSTTSYTYLQMGSHQIRIDNSAGRTDQLWTTGWKPISYDRPASEISLSESSHLLDGIWPIQLSNGRWEGQRICFDVQNKSTYVLKSIEISVIIAPKSASDSPVKFSVVMRPEVYGLLDVGDNDSFCGTAVTFPGQAEWSYDFQSYTGWKR
jgi:hypothetical protein